MYVCVSLSVSVSVSVSLSVSLSVSFSVCLSLSPVCQSLPVFFFSLSLSVSLTLSLFLPLPVFLSLSLSLSPCLSVSICFYLSLSVSLLGCDQPGGLQVQQPTSGRVADDVRLGQDVPLLFQSLEVGDALRTCTFHAQRRPACVSGELHKVVIAVVMVTTFVFPSHTKFVLPILGSLWPQ